MKIKVTFDYNINEDNSKNIETIKYLNKIYNTVILTLSCKEKVYEEISFYNKENIMEEINEFEIKKKLKVIAENYDFLIYFTSNVEKQIIDDKVIYFPFDFKGNIEQFNNVSFTEHAKDKIMYNEHSELYMKLIANDTKKEADFLNDIFSLNAPGKKILDCCCGVGRHSFKLANKGYKITAIDISENQLKAANKYHKHENITYKRMDVRSIKLEQKFDAGMCMWTTYNYLSLDCDLKKFLDGVYEYLNNKGIFILDCKNIPSLEKTRVYRRNKIDGDFELELLIFKRITDNIQNSQYFLFINKNGQKEFCMDEEFVRFYYLEEIKKIIGNKFEVINVFGDYDKSKYSDDTSEKFIVALRKM